MSGRSRAGAGHRWVPVCAGVIGLSLIGIGQLVLNRHAIEDDLTSRSAEALRSADLIGVSVAFSGRDATITGAGDAGLAEQAEAVVSAVDGVRVAEADRDGGTAASVTPPAEAPASTGTAAPAQTSAAAQPPAETTAAGPGPLPVGFTLADGTITVTGTVRSSSARSDLIDAVKATGNGWTVIDRLQVDGSLTESLSKSTPSRLPAVTRLLARAPIDGPKLVIQYNRGAVILRGTPADAAAEQTLLAAASETVDPKTAVVDGLDLAAPS